MSADRVDCGEADENGRGGDEKLFSAGVTAERKRKLIKEAIRKAAFE